MTTREEFVAEARTWIGTPWVHQAYLKGAGCDCIGLVAGVALALGSPEARAWKERPEYHAYSTKPDARLLAAGCNTFLDYISGEEIDVADVLLLQFRGVPTHFALVTRREPLYVLHSQAYIGRVVEHRFGALINGHIVRAYRYRGLEQWQR